MSNKNYEQRVRQIAEEMAKEAHPVQFEMYPGLPHILEGYVKNFIPAARIALKYMAKDVEIALPFWWSQKTKDTYLIDRGLIPSPEQKIEAETGDRKNACWGSPDSTGYDGCDGGE